MVLNSEDASQAASTSVPSANTASVAVNGHGAAGNVSGAPTGHATSSPSTQEGPTSDGASEVLEDDNTVRTAAQSPTTDVADASGQAVAVNGQGGAAASDVQACTAPLLQRRV